MNNLETIMLNGSTRRVRQLAEEIIAERGVRHGQFNLISVELTGLLIAMAVPFTAI